MPDVAMLFDTPLLTGSTPVGGPLLALGQSAFVLVSWWKMLLLFAPLLAWAVLVSNSFDKHAERFHLGREKWGAVHLTLGLVAVAVGLGMPIPAWWGFLIGFVAMVAILAVDVLAFVSIANKDERVPDEHKLKLDMSSFAAASAKRKASREAATVSLEIRDPSGHTIKPPEKETPEYEVRAAAEQIYIKAREMRAARLVITARAKEGASSAELVIDGVRHPGEQYPTARAKAIIDFWKSCAGLDVKDIRRRIVGSCRVLRDAVKTDVRMVSIGHQGGLRLTMQFDAAETVRRDPDDLGFSKQQRAAVDEMVEAQGGVVLLAAPAQNGRTTSLYSMLQLHDAYTSNIQTLELEPMAEIEGVRQVVYEPSDGAEFSTTIRSILRRDPDIVGVAEMPDVETAKEIANADLSRTRVYVSLNADAALSAVQLWVKAVGDPKTAVKGLRGVIAQRLMRQLCGNCKIAYQPPADLVKKLNLPGNVQQLFKKGGQVLIRNKAEICPVCRGIGYEAQIGVFEVMPIGDAERELIGAQDWSGLRSEMRKRKQPGIQQAALMKAVEGETSMEEVQRISQTKKPAKSGQSKKAEPKA